ncbi:uncharacterized protein LOC143841977 [Paroedura picta]|uniref:uncharacterized protein LOC143841977 n=1 Tax=Paroedura picta TaxID=143630 RepID=UPI0040563680
MMSPRNLACLVSWVQSQRSADLWTRISLLGKSVFHLAKYSRAAARIMAEEMVQQQERPEVEGMHQERSTDVLEDAAERPYVCDSLEECGPLQRKCLEKYLECLANQMDEQEEEEASQESQKGEEEEEEELDQASVLSSQEDIWPQPVENHDQPQGVILIKVAPVYSRDRDEQVRDRPHTPRPESPEASDWEQESCYLEDIEDLLQDSGSSTGFYPFNNTFSTLCEAEDSPKPPGRRGVGVQVGETFWDRAGKGDGRPEANPSGKEIEKDPHPPQEGSLPPSPEEASAINNQRQVLDSLRKQDRMGPPIHIALVLSCIVKVALQISQEDM